LPLNAQAGSYLEETTMTIAATAFRRSGIEGAVATDDPVLAAVRKASLASPENRALAHALLAEVKSDPSTWTVRTAAEQSAFVRADALPDDGDDGDG
jgi:hypothetical protein